MPPSSNKLYQKRRGGGLTLSKTATGFRNTMKKVIKRELSKVMSFPVDTELVYRFDLCLFFTALQNPGWFERYKKTAYYTKDILHRKGPKKGMVQFKKGELKYSEGERMAKTRYKRIDVDNRVKFLQDCVATLIGLPDDSNIFVGHQEKHEDPANPRSEVTVTVIDRAQFFKEGGVPHARSS